MRLYLTEETEKERRMYYLIDSNPKIKAVLDLYDMSYELGELVENILKKFDLVEDDEFVVSEETLRDKPLCDKIYKAVRDRVIEKLEDPFEDFGDRRTKQQIIDLFDIHVRYE